MVKENRRAKFTKVRQRTDSGKYDYIFKENNRNVVVKSSKSRGKSSSLKIRKCGVFHYHYGATMRGIDANDIAIKYVHKELTKRYIAIDFEITGLKPEEDRIIEIGAVLFEDGLPVKRFSTLVNAGVNIPLAVTAVNKITNKNVEESTY